jgi:general secretion pathway protein D
MRAVVTPTRGTRFAALLVSSIFLLSSLGGCETARHEVVPTGVQPPVPPAPVEGIEQHNQPIGPEAPPEGGTSPLKAPEFYSGGGVRLAQPTRPSVSVAAGGDVTLNFVNAEIREVVDTVLGTTLGVGYFIDPRVQGTITLRTSRPVPRESVLGVLEDVLAMNGAALVQADGVYKIIPVDDAVSAPVVLQQGSSPIRLDRGFSIHVIPLRYTSAAALREILEPFIPPGRVLRVDPVRNVFLFASTESEADDFVDLVGIFDVDWMANMSFALFPLRAASAKNVVTELQHVFGQQAGGAPANAIDFVAIDRLNAVLAISPQRSYLDQAQAWIERLDRGVEADRRQLYVYYVQNSRATELADVLGQAFAVTVSGTEEAAPEARVAPGLTPTELSRPSTGELTPDTTGTQYDQGGTERRQGGLERPVGAPADIGISGGGAVGGSKSELRIVADARNNALLIFATPTEYQTIEAALKKLDIVPLEVLIEATIAEVTLNDTLKYGLEWFFSVGNSNFVFRNTEPATTTPNPAPNLILSQFPGFSYLLASGDAKVVLNALTQITDVKVISSPQLLVLDNETARLQVGDQVPVATRTSVSTEVSTTAPIVSEIEYRDTGVILDIIPRVNASGLVVLDIIQEVSDVVNRPGISTATTEITPVIAQRRIASTVAINGGDTVALGGLIRDNATQSKSGIPLLSDIPLLGNLFKTTTESTQRTELLVLLTPRVIRDRQDSRTVTDELRKRMHDLRLLPEKIL